MGNPRGFLDFKRENLAKRAPKERIKDYKEFVSLPSEQSVQIQASRCMNCGVPFCQVGIISAGKEIGCPLKNLIPEFNDALYKGSWQEAYERLSLTNPFPEFTGRVCPAPCEDSCVCAINSDSVSIKANEFAIIENAFKRGLVKPRISKVRTGKKIAVIGSGPSGLAAADQLNRRGHSVTVYERFDRAGGLLMYGIPNMKLDKSVVLRRIHLMEQEGVQFVYNANVGENTDAQEILDQYDAVILCCGASNPRDLTAPGRDAKGIYFAVDYLRANTKSLLDSSHSDGNYINAKGKNVLVVGGGDTGNDCVGTAIRQGCKHVIQFEMMGKPPIERLPSNPWPQWPNVLKTDYGQEEAIYLQGEDPRIYNTTVEEFLRDDQGNLTGVTAVNLSWAGGKMTKLDTYPVDVDMVLIAAGFLGCQSYVADAFGVTQTPRTCVATENGTHKTSVPKVFTAGDMRRGQSLVVWGIREGREVAREVDTFLMGYSNLETVE